MHYTFSQLNIYLKIVEKSSITKASQELHMTQPAVSIQLKNFQDQFSIPLTEIIGRNIHITDFGFEIAGIAERIIQEMDVMKFRTKEYEGKITGRLKILSVSTGKYLIPFFLTGFLDMYSGIDLLMDVTNKSAVIKSLKNNEIDFAIVSVLPEELDVNEEILIENKLYLFGNKENSTKNKPLIYREKGSATRQEMENYFQEKKNKERKKLELTSNEAVKQAVIAGIGHSILPLIGIKNELLNESVNIIPRRGLPLKTQWRIIWLRNKKLSPVSEAYLQFIKEEKDKIIEDHFQWFLDYK